MAEKKAAGSETDKEETAEKCVALTKGILRSAAGLVRASNALPKSGEDYEMCNSFAVFAEYMGLSRERILSLLGKVYAAAGVKIKMPKRVHDWDEFLDRIVDGNDVIAERAGILLDEIKRTHRSETVVVPKAISAAESTGRSIDATAAGGSSLGQKLTVPLTTGATSIANIARLRAIARHKETVSKVVQIRKPQKEYGFADCIDNSNSTFLPKIKEKCNARKSIQSTLTVTDVDDSGKRVWMSDEGECVHPYSAELDQFQVPEKQLTSHTVKKPEVLETTELMVVSTAEELEQLRDYLNTQSEFAVDLEHHDYRSFLGFVCLMQISTREKDFIVDPFPVWKHMHLLNDPFTNPQILKVLHGGDRDVEWLQRDFGIYCVNMFDTGRAMRHLGMPKYSLQYLVQEYTGVTLNKQYQTTDWRVRPIPEEMLKYAREDTHYLLYCYDKLRERLLEMGNSETNNLLIAVYADSTNLCKKVFEKPQFDPSGFTKLIATRRTLNNRQLYAMRELWRWRDDTARTEDESVGYVLPAHMMMHIAESLPRDMQSILACCSPVPIPVKEHLLELHRIILDARDRELEKVEDNDSSTLNLPHMREHGRKKNTLDHITGTLLTTLDVHFEDEEDDVVVKMDTQNVEKIEEAHVQTSLLSVLAATQPALACKQPTSKVMQKVHEIQEYFATMASPYECYQLALKDREKIIAAKKAAEERKKGAESESGEKRYSHKDPVICRKPVFNDDRESEIALSTKSIPTGISEEQILTKKALKRRQQDAKKGADMSLDGEAPEKRIKAEIEGVAPVQPHDYSQYSTHMFEEEQQLDQTNSPFGLSLHKNARGRGRGRGRGGRGGRGRGSGEGTGGGRGGRAHIRSHWEGGAPRPLAFRGK